MSGGASNGYFGMDIPSYFADYSIAKEMFHLKYDDACLAYFWSDQGVLKTMGTTNKPTEFHRQRMWVESTANGDGPTTAEVVFTISAPTWEQASEWFCRKYGIYPHVRHVEGSWIAVVQLLPGYDFHSKAVSKVVASEPGVPKGYNDAQREAFSKAVALAKVIHSHFKTQ